MVLLGTSGCSTIKGWFSGNDEEQETKDKTAEVQVDEPDLSDKNIYPLTNRELELRLSKLWARVDQMEKPATGKRDLVVLR